MRGRRKGGAHAGTLQFKTRFDTLLDYSAK